jgi:hypothetical protein
MEHVRRAGGREVRFVAEIVIAVRQTETALHGHRDHPCTVPEILHLSELPWRTDPEHLQSAKLTQELATCGNGRDAF